jgi:prepilin-type N-terminal cleavage/methylation domain-containing protein
MKASDLAVDHQSGFTLVEIIVTLIVGSILGVLLMQVMGTSIERSTRPLVNEQQELGLAQIMENMTADYKGLLLNDATPLATFNDRVRDGNVEGTSDPYYGAYTATLKFLTFTNGVEDGVACSGSDCRVLKVTLTRSGQSLTALFTR